MALTYEHIKQRLVEKFGEQVTGFEEPFGMLTFEAPKELNLKNNAVPVRRCGAAISFF